MELHAAAMSLPVKAMGANAAKREANKIAQNSAMRHKVGENEHWEHFHMTEESKPTAAEARYLAREHNGGVGNDTEDKDQCSWCTAGKDDETTATHLKDYLSKGDIHILIPKNPRNRGERYQIHYETGQAMNKKNEPMDSEDGPHPREGREYPQSLLDVEKQQMKEAGLE